MRPRFQLELPFGRQEMRKRLDAHLACEGCPCVAVFSDHHVDVMIHRRLRHYWSPQLNLEVEETLEGRVVLNGLYGPSPHVWTMFLAAYSTLGFLALFSLMFGLSQLAIGSPPWALAALPVTGVLACLGYGASLVGQRFAAEQMELLRCFLQASLGLQHDPIEAPECPPQDVAASSSGLVSLLAPGSVDG